jgi:hypothetical protein
MGEDEESAQIIESLPKDDWEQREVYAHFGLAIYFCQVLETQLVNYLALLTRVTTGQSMTEAEVDDLFARLFGGTFGRNLADVRRLVGDDWALADVMANALTLRNDLAHHWMRDRALTQGTSDNRQARIDELKAAQEQLREADEQLTARSKLLWDHAGLQRDWIETEYERLREIADRGGAEADGRPSNARPR